MNPVAPRRLAALAPLVAWIALLLGLLGALLAMERSVGHPPIDPQELLRSVREQGALRLAVQLVRLGALLLVTTQLVLTARVGWQVHRSPTPTGVGRRPIRGARVHRRLVERALLPGMATGTLAILAPTVAGAATTPPAATAVEAPPTTATAPLPSPATERVAVMVPLDASTTPGDPDRAPTAAAADPLTPTSPEGDALPDEDAVAVMVALPDEEAVAPTTPAGPASPAAAPASSNAGGEETDAPGPRSGASTPLDEGGRGRPEPAGSGDAISGRQHRTGPGPEDAASTVAAAVDETWTVQPGDHLWSISAETLADAWGRPVSDVEVADYWQQVISANRDSLVDPTDADLLFPGQRITLPAPWGPATAG